MTLIPKWLLRLAGHAPGRERRLAHASRAQERAELTRDLTADDARFRRQMSGVAAAPHVVVGSTPSAEPYRIALADLTSLPAWITAATGAGKSRLVGSMVESVIRHGVNGAPVSVIVVDGKGETADQMLRSVARIAETVAPRERDALLSRVHTLRFFGSRFLPGWPLFARLPGVSIPAQADAVAEVLSDVVGDASIGARQRSTLAALVALAIEFGIPPAALPWLLNSPSEVAALAARSSLPSIRLELSRFEREAQGSIDGLVARLGTILRAPALKAVLSATEPFDFSKCFEPGAVSAFDFGGADLGVRQGVRAMGSLAISALANAAFDPRRVVRGATMIVVDEPQTLMTSVSLGQFERLVTLGRSFGAGGLVCAHQGATQLPPEFQTVLNTNVPLRILGRSAERDVTAASEWLPRTGRVPRRREPGSRAPAGFMSASEEERFRIAEVGRLPPRHFLVADRRAGFGPRILRAPDFDPPAWSEIDPAIAEVVLRGSAGVPRAVLENRVLEIEAEAASRFEAHRRDDEGAKRRPRAGTATAETPDVLGSPQRRTRRGEVP